jgi:hypothetical protein
MGDPILPAKIPLVAMLGLGWVWTVLALWGLGIALKPGPSEGWGLVDFACLMIGVVLSGSALAATMILQPWMTARRRKKYDPVPQLGTLWDREIDG